LRGGMSATKLGLGAVAAAGVIFAGALLLHRNSGSSASSAANSAAAKPASPSATAAKISRRDDPGISLPCIAERIQKAAAPFHWSYKKEVTSLGKTEWEADITPDSITGILVDSAGTRPIKGMRENGSAWNIAVLTLTAPLPTSTFALFTNTPAVARTGTEAVRGEATVQYDVDTARDTGSSASLIKSVLGATGFIKGTVWVTGDGCPIKFALDVEQQSNGGSVEKERYEEAVTRK
jgi:hypothetical protein